MYQMRTLIAAIIGLTTLASCAAPSFDEVLNAQRHQPQKLMASSLDDLGQYSKMVALETHDDALLGSVDKVVIDPVNDDILVCDTSVTHAVYRFSPEGQFKFKYGGIGFGPGEYQALNTFTVLENGNVAIFSREKRILFQADGTLLNEKKVYDNEYFAESYGDRVYLVSFKGLSDHPYMGKILNEKLETLKAFHPNDPKMDKVPYIPFNGLTLVEDLVVVNHFSDFGFSVYDQAGRNLQHIRLPNHEDIDHLWDRPEEELLSIHNPIFNKIHRAASIQSVGSLLFLLEMKQADGINRSVIWDSQTGTSYTYNGVTPVYADATAEYLSMDILVGRYEKGLIGICNNPDKFARYQPQYTSAAHIEFGDQDNPVILFFELKSPTTQIASGE